MSFVELIRSRGMLKISRKLEWTKETMKYYIQVEPVELKGIN